MTTFNSNPEGFNRAGMKRAARLKGSRRLRWIQIGSLIVAFAAALFIWWATNLSLEAERALIPTSPVTDWVGVAIVVFMLSMMASFGAGLAIFMRSKK